MLSKQVLAAPRIMSQVFMLTAAIARLPLWRHRYRIIVIVLLAIGRI